MARGYGGSLSGVLAGSGYRDRRDQIEQQDAALQSNTINQAGALQRIYQSQEAMRTGAADRATAAQDAAQLQAVMEQTGGDPARAIQALLKAGTPKSIELASKLRGLLPKPAEPYTLAPGGQRRGPNGELIAQAPFKTAEPKADTPVPVTPVTIQDPNDPSATIVIDGRTRAVLGKGPKLTQTGAADAKLVAAKPQAKLRVESMIQGIDRLSMAMAELDAMPGLPNITGTIMGRTPNLTNAATSAQAKLDSIKSQIFQSSLQAMREASKTGGAVGNVSDREGDKLERTIAALEQAQGTPQFKGELKKARAQLALSKALIQRSYDEQFGAVQDAPQRRATDNASNPSVDALLEKYK